MAKEIDLDLVALYKESTYAPNVKIITVNGNNVKPIAIFHKRSHIGDPIPDHIEPEDFDLYDHYVIYKNDPVFRRRALKSANSPPDLKNQDIGTKINLDVRTLFQPSTYDPEVLVALVDGKILSYTTDKLAELKKIGADPQKFSSKEV